MNFVAYLLAPAALVLSPVWLTGQGGAAALSGTPAAEPVRERGPYSPMPDRFRGADAQQVRIEQQVTIRISPRPLPMPIAPQSFVSDSFESGGGNRPRWIERKFGKCLPITGIAGVQPGPGNKLILILRDQRVLTASLDKTCRSRDYYSGFLIARNADGQLCTGRDELLSRSGANCKVSGLKQLVQVGD